jgi:uncharacterized protein YjaG (DUF416 family)
MILYTQSELTYEIERLETKGKEIVAYSSDENYPIYRGLTEEEEEKLNSLKELSKNTRQKKGWKRQLK